MKKIATFLTVFALICSCGVYYNSPVKALEATNIEEYNQQKSEINTPDLDAPHTVVTENNLEFYVYDDFAYLSDCKDNTITEITIPDEINGVPVIGITNLPFGFCRSLTSVTLPDTLKNLDWVNLVLPVTRAGSNENPLPTISQVLVSENNPYFMVSDGILYSKDMKTLFGCPPAMDIKELKISEKTETIGDCAFCYTGLERAVVPPNIKHINNNAFTACINLVSAELPESITSISGDMFFLCESLSEVTFKGNIKKIGYGAFNQCKSLTDFEIPETVEYIGSNAFENSGCIENDNGIHYLQNWVVGSDEEIKSAVIKEGTVGIAEMSFFVRKKLELLDVPQSVKYAGNFLFTGLSSGSPAITNYRCSYIHEKTLASTKNMTDIYIYDSECDIFDSEKAIPATYKYTAETENESDDDITGTIITWNPSVSFASNQENNIITGDIVIHGYENSTAQAYAEKYNRKFEVIEDNTLSGDVNGDGSVDIADVISVASYVVNPSRNNLSSEQIANADVHNSGDGLTANDALKIQQYLANMCSL